MGSTALIVVDMLSHYEHEDAYVRHYPIVIPRDAVAHIHRDLADAALRMMETNVAAEVTAAADCGLTVGR